MKTPTLLLILVWPSLLFAQDAAKPEKLVSIERQVQAKEIRNVTFDTDETILSFSVGSDKYYYLIDLRGSQASSYGVLAELRSADHITLRLDPTPIKPGEMGKKVFSFVFRYDHLHP